MRGELHGNRDKYNNIYFRSSWEVLFAKFLDRNNISWQYEFKSFDLINTVYRPDFYLPETNEYIEIKGYWRDDAKLKFDLFKIFYPQENIKVLQKEDLKQMRIL
jgi:predicted nuclease of restriction endonuclease-like RecB superfamily